MHRRRTCYWASCACPNHSHRCDIVVWLPCKQKGDVDMPPSDPSPGKKTKPSPLDADSETGADAYHSTPPSSVPISWPEDSQVHSNTHSSKSSVQPGHLEVLRDLQVAQSRLLMEQQEMEIAVLMASNPKSPSMPPPQYVEPPPLKDFGPHDSVYFSAMELHNMAKAPSAVTTPSVHPMPIT